MNKQGDVTLCLMLADLRKGIHLFKDSQASPACPSDRSTIKKKKKKKKSMEHWWNDTGRDKTEVLGEKRVPVPLCPP